MTMSSPAARVRSKAAGSTTPSWNHTAFAPTATASSATPPASSPLTNTSTTSTGKGMSASEAYPCSPCTVSAFGCTGTTRLPNR